MKSNESPIQQKLITTPIAIIGMASIFPKARTLPEYWDNILNKIDAIVDVPASRWVIDDYYDPDPTAPDKTYCKRGGFIPDVEFDPAEFGLPPNLLEVTDVSQLLSMVVAKECLEDAGYSETRKYSHEKTGVILGLVGIGSKLVIPLMARLQYPVWEKVLRSYGIPTEDIQQIINKIKLAYPMWEENSFPGSIGNVVAGRIANRLDLGGTNCVVDAACASSLAAIKMAVSELIEGRADMMITGGVDTDNSIGTYMSFSKTPAFSKSENVRPFDQDSDGMMVGEGIGMVVLKRLADAKRDGDRVYAVIKAIGTSSDGRYKSIYAPRPAGQAVALRRAYSEAGYSPSTVGLIEAHGTGTVAGDPAEFEGLNEVFSTDNPRKQHIALGSVKSQIGHTKAAAGVASLIKTSLALYHKVLPPTIHINKPNPKLEFEKSSFYLNTERRPWIKPAQYPRRAGVSAFGFGGTNFHVALEENESEHTLAYRLHTTAHVILISAPTPPDLLAKCRGLSERMITTQGAAEFSALVNATQANEIKKDDARVGFTAANAEEANSQLSATIDLLKNIGDAEYAEHPSGIYYRKNSLNTKGKLVALFPGQGSQYVNMGRELAINFPPIRQAFADMDACFDADDQSALTQTVYPIPAFDSATVDLQNQQLTRTEHAQPAIGTFSLGLYKLFAQAGFEADFTAGHSFGELTALCAAGVIEDAAFYTLAKARGKAMAAPNDPNFDAGAMLAVKGDIKRLQSDLEVYPEITLANWNSNNQVVLAGTKLAVATVQKALTEKGYSVVVLPVSAAFHTQLVAHAQQPFAKVVLKIKFKKPGIEVYSNTTGKKYSSDPDKIRQTLNEHILKPVLFKDEIEAIYARGGSIFVEFGPKNILTNLVNNILEGKPHFAIAINASPKKDSDRQLRDAVAQLCVLGLDLRGYDPYALPEKPQPTRKKSSISLKLNGGLYLSPKTRSAFDAAISEKNALSNLQQAPAPVVAPVGLATPPATFVAASAQQLNSSNLGTILDQLQSFQSEALQVHSLFLSNDGEYVSGFTQLVQQELDLLAGNPAQPVLEQINIALQTLERSMNQFHQHQAETLRVHEQYLQNQAELTNRLLEISQAPSSLNTSSPRASWVQPVPAAVTPPALAAQTVIPNNNGHLPVSLPVVQPVMETKKEKQTVLAPQSQTQPIMKADDLKKALLELVSEKTGYPTEMLDLDMDMEADLGIDSIKRVEIMGALQTHYPDLPKIDATALAEMRTLGHIADYINTLISSPAISDLEKSQPLEIEVISKSVSASRVAPVGVSIEEVTQGLLKIVSEKTGYPTEMLELKMDMEADLGIDSIKRVEIMGAMQTSFPELSKIDAANLVELHTLEQIIASLTTPKMSIEPVQETMWVSEEFPLEEAKGLPRGVVALKMVPAPDRLDTPVGNKYICLILDDGTDLTLALADRLTDEGKKVVVVQLPQDLLAQRKLPENIHSAHLTDWSETGLQNTLAAIQKENGPAAIFIHLDPAGQSSGNDSEKEKNIVKTIFLIAKFLKDTLDKAAQEGYAGFMTVTHMDGEMGLASSGTVEPVSGALFGLVKTINLEWDKVFCRAVDLDPEIDAQTAAGLIVAELHDPNRLISEISYHSGERFTLVVDQPTGED